MIKRKDCRGRVLKDGESYRKSDNRYMYRWTGKDGKRHTIYSPDLMELREEEEKIKHDLRDGIKVGENNVTVHAQDDSRNRLIPRGKQCDTYDSYGCLYTRTTGIWQTVWLEFVPKNYIKAVKYYSDIINGRLNIEADIIGTGVFSVSAYYEGRLCGSYVTVVLRQGCGNIRLTLNLEEIHLWEAGAGRLYDLELKLESEVRLQNNHDTYL